MGGGFGAAKLGLVMELVEDGADIVDFNTPPQVRHVCKEMFNLDK